MYFHDTHASLTMTTAEEHKRARMKVEVGVRLALEARQRSEEEHAWLEAEEEARLVEEARLKAEEEEQSRRGMTNRDALPKKQGRKHRNISARLNVEEGLRLSLEAIRIEEEEEEHTRIEAEEEACLVEEERLKSEEEEDNLLLKAEEEARLTEGAKLELEEHERARLKVEEGVGLALESIRRVEE